MGFDTPAQLSKGRHSVVAAVPLMAEFTADLRARDADRRSLARWSF